MAEAHSWDKKIFGVNDYCIDGDDWDYSLELEVSNNNAPKEKLLEAINLLVEEFKRAYELDLCESCREGRTDGCRTP